MPEWVLAWLIVSIFAWGFRVARFYSDGQCEGLCTQNEQQVWHPTLFVSLCQQLPFSQRALRGANANETPIKHEKDMFSFTVVRLAPFPQGTGARGIRSLYH